MLPWRPGTVRSSLALVVLAAALWAAPARAQFADVFGLGPPLSAREAFTLRYGQAVIEALSAALARAAQPGCAANAGASDTVWLDRAGLLYVRYGQAYLDRMRGFIDAARFENAFRRIGGADAFAEYQRLRADPAIAALEAPIRVRQARQLIDETVEMFDRYVLLSQIRLDTVSPIATGTEPLLQIREEEDESALDAFEELVRSNDTPQMRRFIELAAIAAGAFLEAADSNRIAALGPRDWLAGLDQALQALCIRAP